MLQKLKFDIIKKIPKTSFKDILMYIINFLKLDTILLHDSIEIL